MDGICFFKGLCLLFLPNVPGAMFIPGVMSIPDSRVIWSGFDVKFCQLIFLIQIKPNNL